MSGLSFSLGGAKRSAPSSSKPAPAKKPATVNDLFSADSDEEHEEQHTKKQRVASSVGAGASSSPGLPAPPKDPEVLRAVDKLAEFVAKHGRSLEETTRQRNPGDTVFRFLFDRNCPDYKYFDAKVRQFEAQLGKAGSAAPAAAASALPGPPSSGTSRWGAAPPTAYNSRPPHEASPGPTDAALEAERLERERAKRAQDKGDSVAAMEAYMKAMAKKERGSAEGSGDEGEGQGKKGAPLLNGTSFERRKVVAVYKTDGSRGHHMGDFIPPEELAKFMAKTGDSAAVATAKIIEERNAISADNIGHKLLAKMGWKEGEGVGASRSGITAPIKAGEMKQDNLGVGAAAHGEVSAEDDPYEQYRKRMMLGYKYRPNPLGNPRKAYY